MPLVGVPTTWTRPSTISRSSGDASSWFATIASMRARTSCAAGRAAVPAITALRLPPVPGPNGVVSVSPCKTRTCVEVDAELVGDDLGDRRLEALAVTRGAVHDVDPSVRADPYRRGIGGHPAERDRGRLDHQTHPDADQATFGPPRCAVARGARRSRSSPRPARGSRPRSSGRRPCRSASCTEARRRGSRCAAAAPTGRSRGRAARQSIICSRATVSIIHGPRYAPRPGVFVSTVCADAARTRDPIRTREQHGGEDRRARHRRRERTRALEELDLGAEQRCRRRRRPS